jgi:hypothetical protein
MKRILLATPCRDALSVEYVTGMVAACACLRKEFDLVPALNRSTCLNITRGDLVEHAKFEGAEEIVFIDSDIEWTPADLYNLLSHNVSIVGADYCKRVSGPAQGTARAIEGAILAGEDKKTASLLLCTSLPAGFLRIHLKVFEDIFHAIHSRHFLHPNGQVRCEYFPTGLVVIGGWQYPSEVEDTELPEQISEDIGFCRLARHIGYSLWCDTKIKLRHHGDIGFPAAQIPQ